MNRYCFLKTYHSSFQKVLIENIVERENVENVIIHGPSGLRKVAQTSYGLVAASVDLSYGGGIESHSGLKQPSEDQKVAGFWTDPRKNSGMISAS